jgi:hypothetical protein
LKLLSLDPFFRGSETKTNGDQHRARRVVTRPGIIPMLALTLGNLELRGRLHAQKVSQNLSRVNHKTSDVNFFFLPPGGL